MATTFYTPLNNATSKLAANHQTGDNHLTLLTGAGSKFGNPSPSAPIRVTVQGSGPSIVTIFACTARSGDTLSGLTVIEGTTDRAYAVGSTVEMRPTAGTFGDIHGAVNQLEDGLADISLTPGPKGDKGDQGEPGPQGSTGVVSAPSPLAYDAASKTVSFVGPVAVNQVSGLQSTLDSKAGAATVNAHIANTSNPHGVTASQVGLGNVNNTSDANKPVSGPVQTALDGKAPLNSPAFTGTPTAPTATLGDSSTKLATTAFVTTALAGVSGGVSSVAGKTGDVTLAIADVGGLQSSLDSKASQTDLASHVANSSNPHGVTKAQVGLGNVDNTSDANKPVSTATQTALNAKAPSGGSSSITTLGTITVGTWQASVIAPAYIGSGTPGAGKYVDGGTGQWTPLPSTSPSIGNPISGAVAGCVLYIDPSGNLANNAFLKYDQSTSRNCLVVRKDYKSSGQGDYSPQTVFMMIGNPTSDSSSYVVQHRMVFKNGYPNDNNPPDVCALDFTSANGGGSFVFWTGGDGNGTSMRKSASIDGFGNLNLYYGLNFLGTVPVRVGGSNYNPTSCRLQITNHQFDAHVGLNLQTYGDPNIEYPGLYGLLITDSSSGAVFGGMDNSRRWFMNLPNSINAGLGVSTSRLNEPCVAVRAASGQTSNLQEWQDANGNVITKIDTNGVFSQPAIQVQGTGANTKIGFFGATPVAKAATPVTLEDVITVLKNLGLTN